MRGSIARPASSVYSMPDAVMRAYSPSPKMTTSRVASIMAIMSEVTYGAVFPLPDNNR